MNGQLFSHNIAAIEALSLSQKDSFNFHSTWPARISCARADYIFFPMPRRARAPCFQFNGVSVIFRMHALYPCIYTYVPPFQLDCTVYVN